MDKPCYPMHDIMKWKICIELFDSFTCCRGCAKMHGCAMGMNDNVMCISLHLLTHLLRQGNGILIVIVDLWTAGFFHGTINMCVTFILSEPLVEIQAMPSISPRRSSMAYETRIVGFFLTIYFPRSPNAHRRRPMCVTPINTCTPTHG